MKNLTVREKNDLSSYVFDSLCDKKQESFFKIILVKFREFFSRILGE
ncbi:hypothetical protein [uncultured Campylobacter sp.]|nr:hypothetical protein [uncultured Campylobacter sp.]